jgi:hypothetical protein
VIETVPAKDPVFVGVKYTGKSRVCPPATVNGRGKLAISKPTPFTSASEMVTLENPGFISVTNPWALLPIATSPKSTAAGDAVTSGISTDPVAIETVLLGTPPRIRDNGTAVLRRAFTGTTALI